jgi:nitrogen regulatory protein PII
MALTAAKLVTIITAFEGHDRVVDAIHKLGIEGYSVTRMEGHGLHGAQVGSVISARNYAFAIVATGELATRLLDWVERDLVPTHPTLAYCIDVLAVPAARIDASR